MVGILRFGFLCWSNGVVLRIGVLNFSMFHMGFMMHFKYHRYHNGIICVSCETCPIFKWVSGLSIEYYVLLHWKMKAMVSKESPTQASIATSHGLNIIDDSPEDVIFGKT